MPPRAGFTGGHFSGNPWEKISKIYVLVNGRLASYMYVQIYTDIVQAVSLLE